MEDFQFWVSTITTCLCARVILVAIGRLRQIEICHREAQLRIRERREDWLTPWDDFEARSFLSDFFDAFKWLPNQFTWTYR